MQVRAIGYRYNFNLGYLSADKTLEGRVVISSRLLNPKLKVRLNNSKQQVLVVRAG